MPEPHSRDEVRALLKDARTRSEAAEQAALDAATWSSITETIGQYSEEGEDRCAMKRHEAKLTAQAARARFEVAALGTLWTDAMTPLLEQALDADEQHGSPPAARILTYMATDYALAASNAARAAALASDAARIYHLSTEQHLQGQIKAPRKRNGNLWRTLSGLVLVVIKRDAVRDTSRCHDPDTTASTNAISLGVSSSPRFCFSWMSARLSLAI